MYPISVYPKDRFSSASAVYKRKVYLEQGGTEDFKLEISSYSQALFMRALPMFRVRRVVFDGAWHPIGVPHDPTDHEMVEVIRDCAHCNRLAPNADVNRPNT